MVTNSLFMAHGGDLVFIITGALEGRAVNGNGQDNDYSVHREVFVGAAVAGGGSR